MASSCKATKEEHAQIVIWDTTTWKEIVRLRSHALTVTQMAFSHNDAYLLAVSRDRTWSLFERPSGSISALDFAMVCKGRDHERIVWTCAWAQDDSMFATGSRDQRVIIYVRDTAANSWVPQKTLSFDAPVRAIDFAMIKTR